MGDLLDLLLPRACAGCGRPGVAVCARCLAALRGPARLARPRPCPAGLPPVWALGAYDEPLRSLLIAHKERGRTDLSRVLGTALAGAPPMLCAEVVVAVPSSRAAVRSRGYDHTLRLARAAAAPGVEVVPGLRLARRIHDSAGLSSRARAENLAGAFELRTAVRPRLAGRRVVLLDDLMTTGATLVEAARALRSEGIDPVAGLVVAATARRPGERRR
jgi:ComF family protein